MNHSFATICCVTKLISKPLWLWHKQLCVELWSLIVECWWKFYSLSDIKEVNNVDVYFLESETRVILSTAPGNSCELLLCLCQNECLFVIRNTFTKLWTFSTMQLFSLKWFGNHLKSQAAPSLRWISNDQRDSLGDENFCSVWIFWLIFCTDAKNCDPTFSSSTSIPCLVAVPQ